ALDDDGGAALTDVLDGGIRRVEPPVAGGGDAVFSAQILGEDLAGLQPGGGPVGADHGQPGGAEGVDVPVGQRPGMPDQDQVDAELQRVADHRGGVRVVQVEPGGGDDAVVLDRLAAGGVVDDDVRVGPDEQVGEGVAPAGVVDDEHAAHGLSSSAGRAGHGRGRCAGVGHRRLTPPTGAWRAGPAG